MSGAGASAPLHAGLFTIPPGRPFLDDLARALLSGDLPRAGGAPPDPLTLADTSVYLPTRRACARFRDVLLARSLGGALLLPRILPLGAVDDARPFDADDAETDNVPDLPPQVPAMERWLTLTALVQSWARATDETADVTGYPGVSGGAAGELALELMALIDLAQQENIDLSAIDDLIPEELAEYWQRTSRFLSIVTRQWPEHLAERGLIDPVARRNLLLARQAEGIADGQGGPVIIAGSTGSVPATAALMKAVAALPHGAIVLPGLDHSLDDESWKVLAAGCPQHPQAGLVRLLAELGVERVQVGELPGAGVGSAPRLRLVSEVMRPAQSAEAWPDFIADADRTAMARALSGVSVVEAADARLEADTIALMMRETVETPERTAALVTPDRGLARRVAATLASWGLSVADSAGEPLPATPVGRFMELVARVVVEADAVSLLALLKHPLTRLGCEREEIAAHVAALEVLVLRQPWFAGGLAGLTETIEGAGEAGDGARDLVARLQNALTSLAAFADGEVHPIEELARAHREAALQLAAPAAGAALWDGTAGETMVALMDDLAQQRDGGLMPQLALTDYPGLFACAARRKSVIPAADAHPRLFIWGPLEARLQTVDRLILGGLNEGVWPRAVQTGPWLNRAMRAALGLPEPERLTGLSAQDFVMGLCAPEVVLTLAQKDEGAPTVPSRWLARLRLIAGALGLSDALEPQQPWLEWAQARAAAGTGRNKVPPPPAPCPPLAARPRRLSVSDVERWLANPYAIYAGRILALDPVPPLAGGPDERHRGQIIHEALGRFAERYPATLPDDPAGELLAIADALMAEWGAFAHVRAFWRPRFARFAQWFAQTEVQRRAGVARSLSEVAGRIALDAPAGPFELSARADRIDIAEGGSLAIYDYKTGQVDARARAAEKLRLPQLPLEGLIALSGGFDLPGASDAPPSLMHLAYISAQGGREPGVHKPLSDPVRLAREAGEKLAALIARFDDPATPYRALRRPAFAALYAYDDFTHLARVADWRAGGGDDE